MGLHSADRWIACAALLVVCRPATLSAMDGSQSTLRMVSAPAFSHSSQPGRNTDLTFGRAGQQGQQRAESVHDNAAASSTVAFVPAGLSDTKSDAPWIRQVQYTAPTPTTSVHVLPEPTSKIAAADTTDESIAAQPPAEASTSKQNVSPPAAKNLPPLRRGPIAAAQSPPGWSQPNPQLAGQDRQLLDYYGAPSARATLSQMPRRTPIRPAGPAAPRMQTKPFQSLEKEPTVSPYLNLHRNEDDVEGAPNYYAFVRPQVEQLEASRRQQLELLRLQRQLQSTSKSAVSSNYSAPAPAGPGAPARFMDTAQFYGSWQR
jgi:hypothetical protein